MKTIDLVDTKNKEDWSIGNQISVLVLSTVLSLLVILVLVFLVLVLFIFLLLLLLLFLKLSAVSCQTFFSNCLKVKISLTGLAPVTYMDYLGLVRVLLNNSFLVENEDQFPSRSAR